MSKIVKTEAIVLKKKNLLDKDTRVTLFTEKYGRLDLTAFGIKKITSRRLAHIQTGNLITALIYKKNNQFYLQGTQLISAFSHIKEDQHRMNYLYLFFFVLDRLLPENQQEKFIYQLTKKFLINLSETANFSKLILEKYLNTTLICLGYLREEKSINEIKLLIEGLIQEKAPFLEW